jgi:hypothetical protein
MLIRNFDYVLCNVLCKLLPENDQPIQPTFHCQRPLLAALRQSAFPGSPQMGVLDA